MVTTRSTSKAASPGASGTTTTTTPPNAWVHAPTTATLLWFAVSLPLVIWDTGYVLLRPLSMPGGSLHWPLWAPYELYGRVDYVYGWPAFEARNGFTAAQGSLNVVETAMYLAYLWILYSRGTPLALRRDAPGPRSRSRSRTALAGRPAAIAVLIAFSASVMTLSKTVLYWLNEYFSGFSNIGHNSWLDLLYLWIIPNGAWLVLPTYMIYVMGGEIIEGLSTASEGSGVKSE